MKIITIKQMFSVLPIALVQVKACNTSESLLNKIREMVYSLHRANNVKKKVYNNFMSLI